MPQTSTTSTSETRSSNALEIHIDFWEKVVTDVEIKQCEEAFRKLIENPTSHGLHVERLTNIPGKPLYSLRINQGMRIIFQMKDRQNNTEINIKTIQILELTNHYKDSRYIRNRCNPYAAEGQFAPFEPTVEMVNPADIELIPQRRQQPAQTNHKKRKGKQRAPQKQDKPNLEFVFHPMTLYQNFISFNKPQKELIAAICNSPSPVHSVMGPPGAGKSAIALEVIRTYLTDYIAENEPRRQAIFIAPTKELAQKMRHIFHETPCEPPLTVSFLTYKTFLKQHVPSLENRQCVGFGHFKSWWENYLKKPRKKKLPNLFYTMSNQDIYKAFKIISGQTKDDFLRMGQAHLPFGEANNNGLLFDACNAYLTYLNNSAEIYDASLYLPPSPIEHSATLLIADEVQWMPNALIKALTVSIAQTDARIIFFGDTHQSITGEMPTEQMLKNNAYYVLGNELVCHQLANSFRCPKENIALINKCIEAKSIICGGLGSNKGQYTETKSEAPNRIDVSNAIHWLEPHQQLLLNIGDSPEFAIITLSEFLDEAYERFKTPLIFTPENIGGLDFPHIILYRISEQPALVEASRVLEKKLAEGNKPALHRPTDYAHYRINQKHTAIINQQILLLSRNTEHLYIVTAEKGLFAGTFFNFITGELSIKATNLPPQGKTEKVLNHEAWRQEQNRLKAAGHDAIVAAIEQKLTENKISHSQALTFPTCFNEHTLRHFFNTCKTLDQEIITRHFFEPTTNHLAKACFNASNRRTFIKYLSTNVDIAYLSKLLINSLFIFQKKKLTPSPIVEIFYDYLMENSNKMNQEIDISPFFQNIPDQEISIFEGLLSDNMGQKLLFLFITQHRLLTKPIPIHILFDISKPERNAISLKKIFYTTTLGIRILYSQIDNEEFIDYLLSELTVKGDFFKFLTETPLGLEFLSRNLYQVQALYDFFEPYLFEIKTAPLMQTDKTPTFPAKDILLYKLLMRPLYPLLISISNEQYREIFFNAAATLCPQTLRMYFIIGNNLLAPTANAISTTPTKLGAQTEPNTYYVYTEQKVFRFINEPRALEKTTRISSINALDMLYLLQNTTCAVTSMYELLTCSILGYDGKKTTLLRELSKIPEGAAILDKMIFMNEDTPLKLCTEDLIDLSLNPSILLTLNGDHLSILTKCLSLNEKLFTEGETLLNIIRSTAFEKHFMHLLNTEFDAILKIMSFFEVLHEKSALIDAYIKDLHKIHKINDHANRSLYLCMKRDRSEYYRMIRDNTYQLSTIAFLQSFLKNDFIIDYLWRNDNEAYDFFDHYIQSQQQPLTQALYLLEKYPPLLPNVIAKALFLIPIKKNDMFSTKRPIKSPLAIKLLTSKTYEHYNLLTVIILKFPTLFTCLPSDIFFTTYENTDKPLIQLLYQSPPQRQSQPQPEQNDMRYVLLSKIFTNKTVFDHIGKAPYLKDWIIQYFKWCKKEKKTDCLESLLHHPKAFAVLQEHNSVELLSSIIYVIQLSLKKNIPSDPYLDNAVSMLSEKIAHDNREDTQLEPEDFAIHSLLNRSSF